MFFNAPKFWYQKPSFLLKFFLYPFCYIYKFFSSYNLKKNYEYKSSIKVIAIGGVSVGGSGKTIVAEKIASILKKSSKKVVFLSRGYGRKNSKTIVVKKNDSYLDVGDEPLILSKISTVIVGKNRALSAKIAEKLNPEVLILDDGIAQRNLFCDLSCLVIDNEQFLGNGYVLPLGPNRFAFEEILKYIDVIILLKSSLKVISIPKNIPVIEAKSVEKIPKISGKIILFCSIGYPEKFFKAFKDFNVIKKIAFPDHYSYSDKEIADLINFSQTNQAQLITTEKDLMRIPKKFHENIKVAYVDIEWEDISKLEQLILKN